MNPSPISFIPISLLVLVFVSMVLAQYSPPRNYRHPNHNNNNYNKNNNNYNHNNNHNVRYGRNYNPNPKPNVHWSFNNIGNHNNARPHPNHLPPYHSKGGSNLPIYRSANLRSPNSVFQNEVGQPNAAVENHKILGLLSQYLQGRVQERRHSSRLLSSFGSKVDDTQRPFSG